MIASFLAGTVETGGIQSLYVVNRRQIARAEKMGAARSIKLGMRYEPRALWLRTEIVQSANIGHDAGERYGNPRLRRIGEVYGFAGIFVRLNAMQLGVERPVDLSGRAVECDPVARPRHLFDDKPLRLQPRCDLRNVVVAQSEAFPVLLRSQPVPVIGGRRIELLFKKPFESRPLRIGRRQHELRAVNPGTGFQFAAVIG